MKVSGVFKKCQFWGYVGKIMAGSRYKGVKCVVIRETS